MCDKAKAEKEAENDVPVYYWEPKVDADQIINHLKSALYAKTEE